MDQQEHHCVNGDPKCTALPSPASEFTAQSINIVGEGIKKVGGDFLSQFSEGLSPDGLSETTGQINTQLASAILILFTLIIAYCIWKLFSLSIAAIFLAVITLLHYYFGSKWSLNFLLRGLQNIYSLIVIGASNPKISAITILVLFIGGVYWSLRNYWLRKMKDKELKQTAKNQEDRVVRIEQKVDRILDLLDRR